MSDTITAIASAPGEGGIGIVKVSGPAVPDIMQRLMVRFPENPEPRHAYLSRVRSVPFSENDTIDEAIFLYMKGPYSYTGEDVLEIQAHGSNIALKKILRAVLSSGADNVRMAEPGEFTKLAFLNGKMDLSQAEAVIDIIKARTDLSLSIAEKQSRGRLSNVIRNIRSSLLDILAEMAVNIDYPDEDEEAGGFSEDLMAGRLMPLIRDIDELLSTSSIGRIAREGIRVVIAGKPNAGKSSLMNAILGEGRVIVTDIPGTTRDTVEESVQIGGIPIVLVDTAGLRETDDKVERIGIERTAEAMSSAELIILMIDGSAELDERDDVVLDYVRRSGTRHVLAVINKDDLGCVVSEDEVLRRLSPADSDNIEVMITSLADDRDAAAAVKQIADAISRMYDLGRIGTGEMNIVSSERHIDMLNKARADLSDAAAMLKEGEPLEVAELSVRYAYNALGLIIGEEAGEEVLNTVFSRFCLGK